MNIGLFGDSYIDLVWHRYSTHPVPNNQKIWAHRLLSELNAPVICSGLGGSSQYHAIAEWKKYSKTVNFDVAIFTFTWSNRLYTTILNEEVVTAQIEGRDLGELDSRQLIIQDAVNKHYQHLHNREESKFLFELMVKWCLELPEQYPDTKFIFLPNTASSQEFAKKHFTHGELVYFAFEQLSLGEGERVGVYPFINGRTGHLSDQTHEKVKDLVKNIILNYKEGIVPVDYDNFELVNLYPDYYDNNK